MAQNHGGRFATDCPGGDERRFNEAVGQHHRGRARQCGTRAACTGFNGVVAQRHGVQCARGGILDPSPSFNEAVA